MCSFSPNTPKLNKKRERTITMMNLGFQDAARKNPLARILFVATLVLPAVITGALAQEPDYRMEPVVVTATRMETAMQDVAANVEVITREEIDNLPVASAAEILTYIPGLYVEFNGGPGSEAAIRIQGSDFRHVAVYQDGVPLNMLANPRTDLSYLPVENIARIEVFKGAASSAWGSALGGVVNIITREPEAEKPFAADAAASYGEHGTVKTRATAGGTVEGFGWLVSGTHEESDGFIDHTGYRQNAAYAKLQYDAGTLGRIRLAAFSDEGREAQPLPDWPDFWDDREQRRAYQHLSLETALTDAFFLTAEVRHHQYDTQIEDVYADRREVFNDYQDETWGAGLRIEWDVAATHTVSAGFDAEAGEYDWVFYTDTYETGNWALWANDTVTLGPVSLTAGIRYDDNRDFGSEFSPSAGVVYRFSKYHALVRAQAARGFSAPPAAWVHDPTFGNPDLDPETAVNYQLGGEVQPCRYFRAELNLFRADVDDLIIWDSRSERFQNVEEVKRQGIEGGVTVMSGFGLSLFFGGSYVDVFDQRTDARIADIPKLTYTARADYTWRWMTHTLAGRMIDHNSSHPETRDSRFVWDYRFSARLPVPEAYGAVSLFAAVYNLTDADYLYRNNWPQPGRWIEAGVQAAF